MVGLPSATFQMRHDANIIHRGSAALGMHGIPSQHVSARRMKPIQASIHAGTGLIEMHHARTFGQVFFDARIHGSDLLGNGGCGFDHGPFSRVAYTNHRESEPCAPAESGDTGSGKLFALGASSQTAQVE